jgi:prepilin-type N-terminal cleavage/methylation domain-containing protein
MTPHRRISIEDLMNKRYPRFSSLRHIGANDARLIQRSDGFTLIEIALVLVVVGLLISGALQLLNPVRERAKITETEAKLDRIEDALLVWAIASRGCLPCPADGTLVSTNANAGFGRAGSGNQTTMTCENNGTACNVQPIAIDHTGPTNTNYAGVVPWRSLGLSEEDVTDGWGSRIAYAVTDDGAGVPLTTYEAGNVTGPLERHPGLTDFQDGALTVTDTGGTNITTEAAYVLISRGEDDAFAFRRGGPGGSGAILDSRDTDANAQGDNADADDTYVQDDPVNLEGQTYFDDIVRWKSGPLLTLQCGPGSCGNPVSF